MTLTEAIQILSLCKECSFDGPADALEEAHQLGIEALKAYRLARQDRQLSPEELLPGEIKEQT